MFRLRRSARTSEVNDWTSRLFMWYSSSLHLSSVCSLSKKNKSKRIEEEGERYIYKKLLYVNIYTIFSWIYENINSMKEKERKNLNQSFALIFFWIKKKLKKLITIFIINSLDYINFPLNLIQYILYKIYM